MTLRILVMGDIMHDVYSFVSTSRNDQAYPIPVWDLLKQETRLGGAANTANNIKSLGRENVDVYVAGITNDQKMLSQADLIPLCSPGRVMTKDRFVEDDRCIFRVDNFCGYTPVEREMFGERIRMTSLFNFDAVVFSDYDKGVIDRSVVDVFSRVPLRVVDSKRHDLRLFDGCDVLKLNEEEYAKQASNKVYEKSFESLFKSCVITRGSRPVELKQYDHTKSHGKSYVVHTELFPVETVTSRDPTGCGDTHTAALTLSLLRHKDVRRAIKFANKCAAQVVKDIGTSVVRDDALYDELWYNSDRGDQE